MTRELGDMVASADAVRRFRHAYNDHLEFSRFVTALAYTQPSAGGQAYRDQQERYKIPLPPPLSASSPFTFARVVSPDDPLLWRFIALAADPVAGFRMSRMYMAETLASLQLHMLLLWNPPEGRVVGGVLLDLKSGALRFLYVDPLLRRMGHGSKLVGEACARLRLKGLQKATAVLLDEHRQPKRPTPVPKFFLRNGFHPHQKELVKKL